MFQFTRNGLEYKCVRIVIWRIKAPCFAINVKLDIVKISKIAFLPTILKYDVIFVLNKMYGLLYKWLDLQIVVLVQYIICKESFFINCAYHHLKKSYFMSCTILKLQVLFSFKFLWEVDESVVQILYAVMHCRFLKDFFLFYNVTIGYSTYTDRILRYYNKLTCILYTTCCSLFPY